MNAQELRKDIELVNSSIHGAINAQWGEVGDSVWGDVHGNVEGNVLNLLH